MSEEKVANFNIGIVNEIRECVQKNVYFSSGER